MCFEIKKTTKGWIILTLTLLLSLSSFSCSEQNEDKNANPPSVEDLLLRNYKPVSIFNTQVTQVTNPLFPVIDMHSHVYAKNREDIATWASILYEKNIQKVIILTQAHGSEFDSIVKLYSDYPDLFELWCGLDYSAYNAAGFPKAAIRELERCYNAGAKGVGELGDKGKGLFYCKPAAWDMHPDDDRMIPLFAKCAELNMPVNLHIADPKWMYESMDSTNDGLMNAYKWRLDDQEDIVDHAGMNKILENTLENNPNTTFIACHFANCTHDFHMAARLLDKHPNLYLDLSARFAEMCAIPRTSKQFIEAYQDRILYGTDMGKGKYMYEFTFRLLETSDEHIYHDYVNYHWPIHALDLSEQVLEKIYRQNALSL